MRPVAPGWKRRFREVQPIDSRVRSILRRNDTPQGASAGGNASVFMGIANSATQPCSSRPPMPCQMPRQSKLRFSTSWKIACRRTPFAFSSNQ